MASKSGVQIGDQLPNLASEWAYHGELNGARPYYELYMYYTYNCFAPTNGAFQDFFQRYFTGFNSIDDISSADLILFAESTCQRTTNHFNAGKLRNKRS